MSFSQDTRDKTILPPPRVPMDMAREFTTVISDMTSDEKRDMLHFLENSLNNEKRERQRKHQKISAHVLHSQEHEDGVIENLSPGGAFLSTHHPLPQGSEVTLSFRLLNFEFPVMMKADVVWLCDRGMGLKFRPSLKLAGRLAAQKLADALEDPQADS